MAKVSFASPIDEMRGRLAGIIFSANRSGSYIKPFSKSSNPRTPAQSTQRTSFNQFGIRWTNLTDPQRAAWNTYAALPAQVKTDSLGNPYFVSGFNWYISFNTLLAAVDRPLFDGPPTALVPATVAITSLVCNAAATNNCVITWAAPPGNNGATQIFAQLRLHPGRISVPDRNFIQIDFIPFGIATNPLTIPNLDDFFGPIQIGQVLWIKSTINKPQGRSGPSEIANAVAV